MNTTMLVDHPREGVAVVTLNRPDQLNALNDERFDRFDALLNELGADPATKVIVLTGAGRGFCSGRDLKELPDTWVQPVDERLRDMDAVVRTLLTVRTLNTPTIAAVNGPARGGGTAIAVACDMRIAAEQADFGVAFINIGISSGDCGLSWLLPRLVGHGMAAELMLTGRVVSAQEAHEIGLVNRVVPANQLLAQAVEKNKAFVQRRRGD